MIAQLSSHDQIAEVKYFEHGRKREGHDFPLRLFAAILLHYRSVVALSVILYHTIDFVCKFIVPQIKLTLGVYTPLEAD